MKDDERYVKAFLERAYPTAEGAVYALTMVLRFRNKLSGTRLLRTALTYSTTHFDEQLTATQVYAAVAVKHDLTVACVERAIRNAIHDCYEYGRLKLLNDILACSLISDRYAPTNAEFITDVSALLHFRLISNP